MSRARKLLLLGIWVAVLPYLGFPTTWKNILFLLTGLGLMYFGYVLYTENKPKDNGLKTKVFENFSENNNFNETVV